MLSSHFNCWFKLTNWKIVRFRGPKNGFKQCIVPWNIFLSFLNFHPIYCRFCMSVIVLCRNHIICNTYTTYGGILEIQEGRGKIYNNNIRGFEFCYMKSSWTNVQKSPMAFFKNPQSDKTLIRKICNLKAK